MKRKELFNPNATEDIQMINGDTTNLLDLSFIPKDYEIFHKLVDTSYSNNWLPQKVSMAADVYDYKNRLTDDEKEGYDDVLSFLVFLDSIQVNNLPILASFITSPHVTYWLARQSYEEAIHSKSYGWILSSLMSKENANKIVFKWKENKVLLDRILFITQVYQEFADNPADLNFLKSVVGNYLLEGLYFYNGFQYFYNLGNRGLMLGTKTQIAYIQRDELVHCTAFENVINLTLKENPELNTPENIQIINDMFKQAVEWEINFSVQTVGNKVLGMTEQSITDYTYYLANMRLKKIGLEEIFPKSKNPYIHLEKSAGVEDESSNRTNNFEGTSIAYKSPEVLDGWGDI